MPDSKSFELLKQKMKERGIKEQYPNKLRELNISDSEVEKYRRLESNQDTIKLRLDSIMHLLSEVDSKLSNLVEDRK